MVASASTIILLSSCSFVGNIGAALTGFGQAIIFLFVWQIVDLAGYDGDFKNAVFIQALSLFSMQPLLLYKANVIKHSHRRILLLFVPITLVSTPLGQLVSAYVPTKVVQAVAGVLVTLVAIREIYMKRDWFRSFCVRKDKNSKTDEEEGAEEVKDTGEDVESVKVDTEEHANNDEGYDKFDENPQQEVEDAAAAKKSRNESAAGKKVLLSDPSIGFALGVSHNSKHEDKEVEEVPSATEGGSTEEKEEQVKIGFNKATIYTLIAGGASGFLGGMVAIRGPPLIFYFLHPPHPVTFNKNSSRATGVVIMFFNVLMREIFYLVNTFTDDLNNKMGYQKEDWRLYLSIIICSIAGGLVGSKLFDYLKDSRDTIRGILSIFLFMCGVSLLFSAFNK